MRRELVATVGKSELNVVVEPQDDGKWRVVIDGREHIVDAQPVRPGTWSLLVEGRSYVIDLDERKRGTAISAGDTHALTTLEDARRKRLASAVADSGGAKVSGEVVKAPIAGKVVKLLVAVGDKVDAGAGIVVLEAMKMENEIKAESGGTVKKIHVEPGQAVETHDSLVTLE
jgi:biotin carboxyl carrier protein